MYANHEENARAAQELDEAKARAEAQKKAAFMTTVKSIGRAKGLPVESVLRLVESSARRNGISEEAALQRCFGITSGDQIRTMEDNYRDYRRAFGKEEPEAAGELKEAYDAYQSPETAFTVTMERPKSDTEE